MWDTRWLSVLSTRPVEKVLSGVLTPSTAQTWSKPWRSSTSPPHMPSPHHLPPHPGNNLSTHAMPRVCFLCLYPTLTHHVCLLFGTVPLHPLVISFYKAARSKVRLDASSPHRWSHRVLCTRVCVFAVFRSRCLGTVSITVLLSPILGLICLLSIIDASCTP